MVKETKKSKKKLKYSIFIRFFVVLIHILSFLENLLNFEEEFEIGT